MDPQPDILTFPQAPGDKLRLALRRLEVALAEHSLVIAEVRSGIGNLRSATQSLSASLGEYRQVLDGTAAQVASANHTARQLQETARKMSGVG